jgi:hypothetical protein
MWCFPNYGFESMCRSVTILAQFATSFALTPTHISRKSEAMKNIAPIIALLLVSACAKPVTENAATTNIVDPDITEVADDSGGGEGPTAVAEWNGKWVGVEGLVLVIAPGPTAETRKLRVTLLDGTSDYIGTVADGAIKFVRGGKTETIHAGTGAETGLKYLADKDDCLIIKSGEGFCR